MKARVPRGRGPGRGHAGCSAYVQTALPIVRELSAGAVANVSSVTGPLRAGHLASGANRAGPGTSDDDGDQDAGFSTIDSKRIAPVASSRTRKRKGWSMTTGCVYARIAVGPTEIPVAAAAVVPFGVTCR